MKNKIDEKLYLILGGFYIIYLFIKIFKKYNLWNQIPFLQKNSLLNFIGVEISIDIIVSVSLIFIILFLTKRMLNKKTNLIIFIIVQITVSIITLYIFSPIYFIILNYIRGTEHLNSVKSLLNSATSYSDTHFLFYSVIVFIIFSFYYANELQSSEIQKIKIKEQLSKAQVNILKYQLHPHFFFNTLNTISSLIEIDKKKAQDTLADFSDLLRDITSLKNTPFLPLKTEMRIIKKYIDIMLIRFSGHLKVGYEIQDGLDKVNIPSLILQPIIENSIKYGYSYNVENLEINISIYLKDEYIHLIVENDGEKIKKNFKYGNGLKNTTDRLTSMFSNDYIFKFRNKKKQPGVITEIAFKVDKIPK